MLWRKFGKAARNNVWPPTAHGTLSREQVKCRLKELSELLQLDIAITQKASVLDSQEKTLKLANQFDAKRCKLLIEELVEIAVAARSLLPTI